MPEENLLEPEAASPIGSVFSSWSSEDRDQQVPITSSAWPSPVSSLYPVALTDRIESPFYPTPYPPNHGIDPSLIFPPSTAHSKSNSSSAASSIERIQKQPSPLPDLSSLPLAFSSVKLKRAEANRKRALRRKRSRARKALLQEYSSAWAESQPSTWPLVDLESKPECNCNYQVRRCLLKKSWIRSPRCSYR